MTDLIRAQCAIEKMCPKATDFLVQTNENIHLQKYLGGLQWRPGDADQKVADRVDEKYISDRNTFNDNIITCQKKGKTSGVVKQIHKKSQKIQINKLTKLGDAIAKQ